jgi:hydrogenase large subunit
MTQTKRLNIPLNRVEGDLELQVEIQDGVVANVWSSGTMYRGFENILVERGAMDGLVITPRICGICSTAHLSAAARALDMISGAQVPDHARRIRNLALMVEHVQSDARHAFLLFAPDFANPVHADQPLFAEAVRRYAPLQGETAVETIRETKKVMEIVAILGGQWPLSSFMVPGGVASRPSTGDLTQCKYLLEDHIGWYERRVLGCSLERWQAIRSLGDLNTWMEESPAHANSEVGFILRYARGLGLDKVGKGCGNFISYGSLDLPEDGAVHSKSGQLIPAGFAVGANVEPFDQSQIAEHVAHSWFHDYGGGKHPFEGETKPYATGNEGERYSWAKAPRYHDLPAETGPLAEAVIAGAPLIADLIAKGGVSVLVRELARMTRPVSLFPAMRTWVNELIAQKGERLTSVARIEAGEGYGLIEAARGGLGHWVKIRGGRISHYQIISPTSWNGSPRDSADVPGPWEQALIGAAVRDPENPVEVGHIIRSFDACLVCTVHSVDRRGETKIRLNI